jgi:hypothetical protein
VDVEDLFIAHILGMDTLARGLRNAAKLLQVINHDISVKPISFSQPCDTSEKYNAFLTWLQQIKSKQKYPLHKLNWIYMPIVVDDGIYGCDFHCCSNCSSLFFISVFICPGCWVSSLVQCAGGPFDKACG